MATRRNRSSRKSRNFRKSKSSRKSRRGGDWGLTGYFKYPLIIANERNPQIRDCMKIQYQRNGNNADKINRKNCL